MNAPHDPPDPLLQMLAEEASKEQRAFVEAVRDLPMLLVRDASGKVTRLHFVER